MARLSERLVVEHNFAMVRLQCSVIACTARHGQIVFTGVAPRLARLCVLVLPLGHHLHKEARPEWESWCWPSVIFLQGKAWPD